MFHVHLTSHTQKSKPYLICKTQTIDPPNKLLRFSWIVWKVGMDAEFLLNSFSCSHLKGDNSTLLSGLCFFCTTPFKSSLNPCALRISTSSPSALENSQQHALIKSFASSWTWWERAGVSVCSKQVAIVSVHQSSLEQWFSTETIPPSNTKYTRARSHSSWVLCK